MKRLCSNKDEVLLALPLVREALAVATGVTLDCTADRMTLTIDVDMAEIVRFLEDAVSKMKEKS